jgi:sulfate adenylyltransferase subunit 1 (EFTu-like GTPase family)
MFSDTELVTKSLEEMRQEIESLLAEAARQRSEYEAAIKRVEDLRRESVDARPSDMEKAELLWLEAENLQSESKELLRLSVEKTLKAGEIKHRLDIRAQIEAIDVSDEIWKKAAKTGRN